jgi:hypothetical protein
MIVTTGGRSTSSSSASSNSGSSSTSSAAWMISTFFSNESASTWIASSGSVWVSVAISPSSISFLITSADESPSDSATSDTVAPELTGVGGASCSGSGCAVRSGSTHGVRRRRPRRRGGCCGGGGPCWRREACESMTTRRRRPAAPPPPSERTGRCGRAAGCFAGACGFGAGGSGEAAASPPPFAANARSISASSTLEAAALTSMPAPWSTARTSFEEIPLSLAISWTRFLAIRTR